MADVFTTSSAVYIPEIVAAEVTKGLAGRAVMRGSGAASIQPGLRVAQNGVGSTVNVPYFINIGEADELADGAPIQATQITSAREQATVRRFGKGAIITRGANGAGQQGLKTPEEIVGMQLATSMGRAIDKALIDATYRNTTNEWDAYTNDISGGAGAAANFSYDAAIDTIGKLGEEGLVPEEYAGIIAHSKILIHAMKMKDANGRPLAFQDTTQGVQGGRFYLLGIPVLGTDRAPNTTGVYSTAFVKKNALVCWFDETAVAVDVQRQGSTDSWRFDCNTYAVVHRYKNLDGMVNPGVAILKSKVA